MDPGNLCKHEFSVIPVQNIENYDTYEYDDDEKDKTM
jgi:hypothetical protein